MKKYKISDFDSIKPYEDSDIKEVFDRLIKEEAFQQLLRFLFPDSTHSFFMNKVSNMTTIRQFQNDIISDYVKVVIDDTSKGVTATGLESLSPKESYLYISNHRDILLDPAILNVVLVDNGFDTTEIAIGDNLLIYPWITDLVKLNRTFIVNRNLPLKQTLESFSRLSNYIRYKITKKKTSIWIAQREGRSKDGNDQTQISLLKMLNMSGTKSCIKNFKELKIVPVSISYERDPCDYLKALEFLKKKKDGDYQKTYEDDMTHMGTGLKGRKERIDFCFGKPIENELNILENINDKNERFSALAEIIDKNVHLNYKLWPGNYIAWDILNGKKEYSDKYTPQDITNFNDYVADHINRCNLTAQEDKDFIQTSLLEMYANPVKNIKQYEN
ncbi:MAG: 1-acyl-sn-glycerol-3-phosphate acyltransferase [Marinilabiliaceae bacterium]|nr:1-acyl-sn-glycerol-3-phosphate acyltransferase [Marinilabiliaceae bacterium]